MNKRIKKKYRSGFICIDKELDTSKNVYEFMDKILTYTNKRGLLKKKRILAELKE